MNTNDTLDGIPPDIPPDIAERVARRERRRAHGVKFAILVGSVLVCAGIALAARAGAAHPTPPLALALMAAGLVVAFPLAALLALVLGPTWRQRRQHYALLRRQHGMRPPR